MAWINLITSTAFEAKVDTCRDEPPPWPTCCGHSFSPRRNPRHACGEPPRLPTLFGGVLLRLLLPQFSATESRICVHYIYSGYFFKVLRLFSTPFFHHRSSGVKFVRCLGRSCLVASSFSSFRNLAKLESSTRESLPVCRTVERTTTSANSLPFLSALGGRG